MGKRKGGTESATRKHKYVSFREKIDSIKIDPIRRTRKAVTEYGSDENSYFITSFQNWRELNMSGVFTDFSDKVEPCSRSLALILHYKDDIAEMLFDGIKQTDKHSMEPLLDLLIQFARDLGPDFEAYFGKTLQLLGEIATNTTLPQNDYGIIILQVFNCMAYLFKYLSRLLAEDLKPTYNAIKPLMGSETKQKDYVTRFAAESLSFLLRKCSGESLENIMQTILDDAQETKSTEFFKALTILVGDSMMSTGNVLHSKTANILSTLLNNCQGPRAGDFTASVLAAVLHHSRQDSAGVVYDTVYKYIDSSDSLNIVSIKVMFVLAGLRKGSRVTDWSKVFDYSIKVFTNEEVVVLLELASTLLICAEFNSAAQYHSRLITSVGNLTNGVQFLAFCNLVLTQNKEAFANFVIPSLKKFITSDWKGNENGILLLLVEMHKHGLLSFEYSPGTLQLSNKIEFAGAAKEFLLSDLDMNDVSIQLQVWYYLELFRIAIKPEDALINHLPALLSLLQSTTDKTTLVNALIGKVLSLYATGSKNLILQLKGDIERMRDSEAFLQGYLDLVTATTKYVDSLLSLKITNHTYRTSSSITKQEMEQIVSVLSPCFNSVNHSIRYSAALIVNRLHKLAGVQPSRLLSQIQLIEEIPLDLSNTRNLTMHIRNLALNYSTSGTDEVMDNIVPRFLFGLLSIRLQPVWQATFEAIAKIGDKGADLIWTVAYYWLQGGDNSVPEFASFEAHVHDEYDVSNSTLNCTNLNSQVKSSYETLDKYETNENSFNLLVSTSIEPADVPQFMRNHSLQALTKVPRVAERHAKYLVPYLLHDDGNDDEEDSTSSGWEHKDRLQLMELFSLFGNPKGMYQSEKVYERFLYLLGNRTSQVQKLALKCILTYKDATIRKYADSLNNLLNDTQFRDEVVLLVNNSAAGEGTLHDDDRHAILPLVVRILFGRAQIARTGGGVKQNWRGAIVKSLNNVEPEYVRLFVSLATSRLDAEGFLVKDDGSWKVNINHKNLNEVAMIRRELGFVTMLERIVDTLKGKVVAGIDLIMEALLFSMYHSQTLENSEDVLVSKNCKAIRTLGIKSLDLLFDTVKADWTPYYGIIFEHFISPKLDNYAPENLGQVSSMMKFFQTMASTDELVKFFTWGDSVIPEALFSCLRYDAVKDSVVELIMSTMAHILELKDNVSLLRTCAPMVLERMPVLFSRESSNDLLNKEGKVLVDLLSTSEVSLDLRKQLIQVSLSALEKPTNKIKVDVKVTIMQALTKLLVHEDTDDADIEPVFVSLSQLFRQFTDRKARENLALLYQSFGDKIERFAAVGDLLVELNAYSKRRLGEIDFDRRLPAFAEINEQVYGQLSATEWLPLLHNMLFFIKDKEELALRTNASYSIKRFIDCFSGKSKEEAQPYLDVLQNVLLKAVRLGVREENILFRQEYITILAYLISDSKNYDGLDDMKCLLVGGDIEANFFYNVTHVQQHRRQRAIRRLAQFAEEKRLRDTSIAHYLLPIIEHYVEDPNGDSHNVATETITTVGILTKHLTWNQYHAITKRYVSYLNSRPASMKINIRLIDAVANSLLNENSSEDSENAEAMDAQVETEGHESADPANAAEDNETSEAMDVDTDDGEKYGVLLKDNLPGVEKLSNFITLDIVPIMQSVLKTRRDEEEDDLTVRIPLAIPIVKFLKVLPDELLETKLPGVLTGFCQILRAKSQPLRDMIRKSIGKIGRILGARYIVFIIRELKGALRRGTQLHVLGYSVHSLLREMKEVLEHGDLDEPSEMISEIIMEDTFGVTASEKEAEDYTSKMKEVKQHKSYDTGQILASNISLEVFSHIIEPVKSILLYEKLTLTIERKIEELLRRVAMGLTSNEEATELPVLKMCHELYEMTLNVEAKERAKREKLENETPQEAMKRQHDEHFLVTLDSRHWGEKNAVYVQNLYIIVKFVLDALRNVLHRSSKLMTAENVAGFLPMMEAGLGSSYESVQIASLRALSLVIKLPIPDMQAKLKTFGRQTVAIIKGCVDTNSELCQAALKFMATLVRLKSDFTMKDGAYAYLLERIKPDLEEPDRQGVTFTFIKAVLQRKVILPEVYDLMDMVAKVMVTNQTKTTRDTCRSCYFQFLTEYPQGEKRLNKQLQFLVSNLEYDSPDGRLSVMEMMHLLLTKIQNDQIQSVTTSFFVALVLVLVNDDVTRCREHAAALIQELLGLIDSKEQQQLVENYCSSWVANNDEPLLLRGGLQVTGLYIKTVSNPSPKLVAQAEQKIMAILEAGKSDSEETVTWDVLYFGMQLLDKMVERFGDSMFGKKYQRLWDLVEGSLLYPHTWVRLAASRLVGRLFKATDEAVSEINIEPLQSTAFKCVRQLGAAGIEQELGVQIVKNLVFITKRFESNATPFVRPKGNNDDDDEEEENDNTSEMSATAWLVRKVSSVLRGEKRANEMVINKNCSIQYLASVTQVVSKERLSELGYDMILAFYQYSVSEDDRHKDYRDMCLDAMKMMQDKLGVTEYLSIYNQVRQMVQQRRIERKSKRAVQAVTEPEMYARKKMRKNLHKRDKRRNNKDENGYYLGKKKQRS